MKGALWTLAALVAAIAWLGAFAQLASSHGLPFDRSTPIGLGLWVINCGAVWFALRLRSTLRATGSGKTRARFDAPGTQFALRMVGALALALSLCVPALLVAWIRLLFV